MSSKLHMDLLAAFLIPVAILALTFLLLGIYPFGTRNIFGNDLYLQYMPIMAELQSAIHEGGSIFYSFRGGLGANFYALNTYQNASPVTWLFLAIFRRDSLEMCVVLMILFKIGMISCAMYYYLISAAKLSETSDGRREARIDSQAGMEDRMVRLALGTLYSLSGYVIAYYFNVMWLDTIAILPFVILGLRKVMRGKEYRLYVISLALMLFTNYYMGLLMCIFVFLYFFVIYFGEEGTYFWKNFIHIGLLSVLASMLSMIVLLPTLFSLLRTGNYALIGSSPRGLFYYDIPTIAAQLFPGCSITIAFGPPNLYAGLVSLVLFILYILNRGIEMRKRIVRAVFVLFLIISTDFIPADLVWHLFHLPNGIPARYSFVLAFVLVEMAAELLEHVETIRRSDVILAVLCVFALLAVAAYGADTSGIDKAFLLFCGIALPVLYGFVFLFVRRVDGSVSGIALTAVILLEIILSVYRGIGAGGLVLSDRFYYHREEISELIETAAKEDPFARLEILGTDHYNAPYVYGYNGASVFASSIPADNYRVLDRLLNDRAPETNRFIYRSIHTDADAALNIRYYISLDGELEIPGPEMISEAGGCYLYKNPYRSSLGYMLPEEMKIRDTADLDRLRDVVPTLSDGFLDVCEMKGGRVSADIDVRNSGILMTTIPYDEGWRVEVDGRTVKETDVMKYFVSFPLEAGVHSVRMRFVPKGFVPGAIISVTAIIACTVFDIDKKHRKLLQFPVGKNRDK